MDKNNNGIDDRKETLILYSMAVITMLVAIIGFFYKGLDGNNLTWLFGLASALVGGRNFMKSYLK